MWYHINRIKGKKSTFSVDIEKAFDKMQCPFMIKTIKLSTEEMHINKIKTIYENPHLTSYSMVKDSKIFLYDQEQDKGTYFHHSHST